MLLFFDHWKKQNKMNIQNVEEQRRTMNKKNQENE